MPAIVPSRKSLIQRRIYWALVLVWAVISFTLADRMADGMKFRINDLSVIPGAGMIMRDTEGGFFHVNQDGKARMIFPELGAGYRDQCLDCTLVTGEQMSQTNEFCAAGVRTQLPKLDFELPCQSWAVIGDGPKVVAVTLFLVPLLLWPLLRAIARSITGIKPVR